MQFQIPTSHPQITQGATKQQTYIFPVNQPDFARFSQQQTNRYVVDVTKSFEGATKQQTYVFPVNQYQVPYYTPDINRYGDENDLGRNAQLDGATNQQTFPIPPVSQPLNYSWSENRYVDPIIKRFEGATKQQSYIFPLAQPELRYYLRNTFSEVFPQIHGVSVVVPQSYIFPVNQPEESYYKYEVNRYLDEITKRFEGATNQQTFPVPTVNQPLMQYYLRNTVPYVPVANLLVNPPVSAIHKYYTGQFHTTKAILRRGIGF